MNASIVNVISLIASIIIRQNIGHFKIKLSIYSHHTELYDDESQTIQHCMHKEFIWEQIGELANVTLQTRCQIMLVGSEASPWLAFGGQDDLTWVPN